MPLEDVVIQPDGKYVYVSSSGASYSRNRVWKWNTQTHELSFISLEGHSSGKDLAINADGTRLYIADGNEHDVIVFAIRENRIMGYLDGGTSPSKMRLSEDGKILYTNWTTCLSAFDTASFKILWTKELPLKPETGEDFIYDFVIGPDNKTLYTGVKNYGLVSIDTITNKLKKLIKYPSDCLWGINIGNDGKNIYLVDYDGGEVVVIDIRNIKVKGRIQGLMQPETINLF